MSAKKSRMSELHVDRMRRYNDAKVDAYWPKRSLTIIAPDLGGVGEQIERFVASAQRALAKSRTRT